ncbi:MAG: histidine phosphatase family protein [Jatrophihabitans sp.]|uniref:histidine phosphatase family protein n=1 Tax=Jatrophihabitans sp. TaxID=1932789 RepID=UPI003F80328C
MTVRELLLVRHGESTANVAREAAEQARAEVIAVEARDADVPLSGLGRQQAAALGRWFAAQPPERRPTRAYTSPYLRARQTAEGVLAAAGSSVRLQVDERLRDKELGVLDTLTSLGVRTRYPQERQRREWLGKFYYRAPGGESWADIALRLRAFLLECDVRTDGERLLVVAHDSVIALFRYICLEQDEATVLEQSRVDPVANASLTWLVRADEATWQLRASNQQDHLLADGDDLRTTHGAAPSPVHPRPEATAATS